MRCDHFDIIFSFVINHIKKFHGIKNINESKLFVGNTSRQNMKYKKYSVKQRVPTPYHQCILLVFAS